MSKKSTKRALLLSVLSIVLCVSMLVGSTFAWFTDTASTGVNTITAGNLDVGLYYADGAAAVPAAGAWKNAENQKDIFCAENALWEPGYTTATHIKIANEGNLALKYKLEFSRPAPTGEFDLADVIDVYFKSGAAKVTDRDVTGMEYLGTLASVLDGSYAAAKGYDLSGFILAADEETGATGEETFTIVLKMQESAGNDYKNTTVGGLTINLYATQKDAESDSFDNQYDAEAQYPVTNFASLKDALETGKPVELVNDIVLEETLEITKNAKINLNGKKLSANANENVIAVSNGADLTISGGELDFNIDDASYATTYHAIAVTNDTDGTTTQVNLENVKLSLNEPAVDWNDNGIYVSADAGEAVLNIGEGTVINTTRHLVFVIGNNATVNMTDGEINMKNFSTAAGSTMSYGIDMAGPNADFNMTGGTINVAADFYTNVFTIENDGVTINLNGGTVNASGSNTRIIEKYGNCNPTVNITDGVVNLTDGAAIYR